MRELVTIGSLHNLRTMRALERSARLAPMRRLSGLGQTNPNYVAPSLTEVDAEPPGAALTAANVAMLNHFAADGVPSEHTSDPFVLAFQQAYNKDPATWAARRMKLGEDGGFGDNTHDASAALVDYTGGGAVPPVNSGASPAPSVAPAVTPAVTPPASSPSPWPWVLGIGAAAAVAYAVHRAMKRRRTRRTGRARALPSRAIVLT
jgi:hypothetical protein